MNYQKRLFPSNLAIVVVLVNKLGTFKYILIICRVFHLHPEINLIVSMRQVMCTITLVLDDDNYTSIVLQSNARSNMAVCG